MSLILDSWRRHYQGASTIYVSNNAAKNSLLQKKVKTRSDVETFKTVPASLTKKIIEQGKLLYGQGKTYTSAILAEKSTT
ncbi:hypothetical protein [Dulcicalothrix desertica]|uniref:hypothetical protein n=1 Tax=Dulcicalothrix desertica TaxID=32056 RepID=UPI001F482447|nr:hypothetical protein [Dulcicalothrix desertica]